MELSVIFLLSQTVSSGWLVGWVCKLLTFNVSIGVVEFKSVVLLCAYAVPGATPGL